MVNTIANVFKVSGTTTADQASEAFNIGGTVNAITKCFIVLTFSHAGGATLHADTFKSYDISSTTQFTVYSNSTTGTQNSVTFEGFIIEYTSGSDFVSEHSAPSTDASPTLPILTTISSITLANSSIFPCGHNHNAGETTIGSEEFDQVRLASTTTWELDLGATFNSGPQIQRVTIAKWGSTVTCQRGTAQIDSSASSDTLVGGTDFTAVDRTNTILIVSHQTLESTSLTPDQSMIRAFLNSSGNIVVSRNGTPANVIEYAWELIEFDTGIINVEHAELTVSDTNASGTATITDIGTLADATAFGTVATPFGLGEGSGSSTASAMIDHNMARIELTNVTTITATRGGTSTAVIFGVQAVQWIASSVTFHLAGTTRDFGGSTLGTVRCILFKRDNVAEASRVYSIIAHQNSNGSGAYDFTGLTDDDSLYMVVAVNQGSPIVRGCTNDNLQPVSE